MNFVDFQKYIGTLATKYSDFEFNIRIYDLDNSEKPFVEGLSSDKYVDYNGKESKYIKFTEKREGSLMIEAGFKPTSFLDNIITEIKSKAANLGLQQYNQIEIDELENPPRAYILANPTLSKKSKNVYNKKKRWYQHLICVDMA